MQSVVNINKYKIHPDNIGAHIGKNTIYKGIGKNNLTINNIAVIANNVIIVYINILYSFIIQ